MSLRQRREPTRSRHYLDGAKGSECTLQIPGVCTGGTETTVSAHIRDENQGRGVKASDLSTADACYECHKMLDGHSNACLTREDWLFYSLRGLQRTLERRREQGRLIVRVDPEKLATEKPVPSRKPKDQRAKIQSNPTRKIQSRGFEKKPRRRDDQD